VAKTTSGFNSDHTILQHAHDLLLESPFVPSTTNRWAVRAKIRQNGRLGGCRAKTGSRNMAATQKINFLTLVSYSLLQTVLPKMKTIYTPVLGGYNNKSFHLLTAVGHRILKE